MIKYDYWTIINSYGKLFLVKCLKFIVVNDPVLNSFPQTETIGLNKNGGKLLIHLERL